MLKISIITAVFNRVDTVLESLSSVQAQNWNNLEHVIIDGGSTDGTVNVLRSCLSVTSRKGYEAIWSSEPDQGLYDAINKGFNCSTGDVIGLMHSDDFFADNDVLASVADAFSDSSVDAVYGDLDYVDKRDSSRIVRRWRSNDFRVLDLKKGWMPPHPTLFLRRSVIIRLGGFDTSFKIAADYDATLRYFGRGNITSVYIPRVLVKMRLGGESNRSLCRVWLKTCEDYAVLRKNGIGGVFTLALKNISKLKQFF